LNSSIVTPKKRKTGQQVVKIKPKKQRIYEDENIDWDQFDEDEEDYEDEDYLDMDNYDLNDPFIDDNYVPIEEQDESFVIDDFEEDAIPYRRREPRQT
jgi:hypothetical protein